MAKPKVPNGAVALIIARKQAIIHQSPAGMWSELFKPKGKAGKPKN